MFLSMDILSAILPEGTLRDRDRPTSGPNQGSSGIRETDSGTSEPKTSSVTSECGTKGRELQMPVVSRSLGAPVGDACCGRCGRKRRWGATQMPDNTSGRLSECRKNGQKRKGNSIRVAGMQGISLIFRQRLQVSPVVCLLRALAPWWEITDVTEGNEKNYYFLILGNGIRRLLGNVLGRGRQGQAFLNHSMGRQHLTFRHAPLIYWEYLEVPEICVSTGTHSALQARASTRRYQLS